MSGNADNRIVVRFGDELMEAGFTSVPNLVLEHYAEVGISEGELVFTLHIWSFWWNRQLPYPSLSTVARRMGKSWRSVHRYAKSLEQKKLLKITPRYREDGGQTSSLYDFEPMIEAIRRFAHPPVTSDRGGADRFDTGPLSRMSEEEYEQEKDPIRFDPSNEIHQIIGRYVEEFAREFRDRAPLRSSQTRAVRLFAAWGGEVEDFVQLMYTAREKTKRYTGNIRAGDGGRRSMMAYFFAVLDELVDDAP